MGSFMFWFFKFILYGVAWFCIFSITIDKNEDIYFKLHKLVKASSEKKNLDNSMRKEIHPKQVIDALKGAFEPK